MIEREEAWNWPGVYNIIDAEIIEEENPLQGSAGPPPKEIQKLDHLREGEPAGRLQVRLQPPETQGTQGRERKNNRRKARRAQDQLH